MKVPRPKDAEGNLLWRVCRLQSWWKDRVELIIHISPKEGHPESE